MTLHVRIFIGSNRRRLDNPGRFNAVETSLSLGREHILMLVPAYDDDGLQEDVKVSALHFDCKRKGPS